MPATRVRSWARRFGLWAAYAFGQPLPPAWPGVGRNAFAHESGIHADGALKDRGNYELYDDSALGPFPSDWYARDGRVMLTGEYGGKAGFRHVLDGLGIPVPDGDLVFSLVQLCASATGKPLTDDELRLIAGYPHQLALLYPGQLRGRAEGPGRRAETATEPTSTAAEPDLRARHDRLSHTIRPFDPYAAYVTNCTEVTKDLGNFARRGKFGGL